MNFVYKTLVLERTYISAILVYSLIEFEDLILICDFVQKLSAKNKNLWWFFANKKEPYISDSRDACNVFKCCKFISNSFVNSLLCSPTTHQSSLHFVRKLRISNYGSKSSISLSELEVNVNLSQSFTR